MNREEKAGQIAEVQDKFKAAKMAIVTEYRGLTVTQMGQLRREVRAASGEYKVIKNTMARLAMKNDGAFSALEGLLEGPNGWVFSYEDPVNLSKALVKFTEQNEMLKIKGGVLEGEFLEPSKVKDLAKLPSRPELQAKLLALMQAPATQLVRLIQEPGARVARLLETIRKTKSE
ncbi:MAG: 50S ribosomal protein L10 [Deltaproteobacteria bacterium]|nr:50S ribosomal protein L10 [Deltaproteobacteria bacterium]